MASKILAAGDIIEAKCTRCKKVMNHTIIALLDNKPARVECNTCKGVHNYRPATAEKTRVTPARKAAATRKTKADPTAAEREEWAALRPEMDVRQAKAYDMQSSFKNKSLVRHPKFGLGVVKRNAGPHKVEILFEDGVKLLRCQ